MLQRLSQICMSWKGRIKVVIRGSWDLLTAFFKNVKKHKFSIQNLVLMLFIIEIFAEFSLKMKPYLHLELVSYPAFPIASA